MATRQITNSERATWTACRRLWLLKYALGLESTTEDRSKMTLGSMGHKMLDVVWNSDGNPDPRDVANSIADVASDAFNGKNQQELESTGIHAGRLVADYIEHWGGLVGDLVPGKLLETETVKNFPHVGIKVTLDKVIEKDGKVFIYDHKFTSLGIDQWIKQLNKRQSMTYSVVGQHIWGSKFGGFYFDIVHTGTKDKSVLFTEKGNHRKYNAQLPKVTHSTWAASGHIDGSKNQDLGERLLDRDLSGHFFRRHLVYYTPSEIQEFFEEEGDITQSILHDQSIVESTLSDRHDIGNVNAVLQACGSKFHRNFSHCNSFGRRCPLEHVCASRMIQENLVINTDFENGRYGASNKKLSTTITDSKEEEIPF